MPNFKKISLISFIIILGAITFSCWALNDNTEIKTISGRITDTDWVKSTITIRYFQPFSSNPDEITIFVPREAKILCGSSTLYRSDLEQSDPVTVSFYDTDMGLRATKVVNHNNAKRGVS
jgi:hypothetical protein